jgi:methane monooxygenase component A beta chain
VWQGIQDWNEILWGVHAVYDSIFGQFVRREFFGRMAAHYGDSLTPFFLAQSQTYFQINRAGIQDLYLTCLANDPAFAGHNRRWLRTWTYKWLSKTVEAMRDFMGIYAKVDKVQGLSDAAAVTATVRRVLADWTEDYANGIDFKIDLDKTTAYIVSGLK